MTVDVSFNLISLVIGLIFGSIITLLFIQTIRPTRVDQKETTIINEILSLEKGLRMAYDILNWFRRPNKRREEKKIKTVESNAYERLFDYFLKNKLIERVATTDVESYCLTEEGKKICDMLDEFSEQLALSIQEKIE
jgi:predicted transcriptional regulator